MHRKAGLPQSLTPLEGGIATILSDVSPKGNEASEMKRRTK